MIRSSPQRQSAPRTRAVPVVLTVAGSDSSGGAGLQADLKTFTAMGVYGTTAVTCVVAENPGRVAGITPLSAARVAEQIALVLEAFPVAAIKTGMLYSAPIIAAVEAALAPLLDRGIPLVIDPVMVASTGRALLKPAALRALRQLMKRATVITPNRDEAAMLWGQPIATLVDLENAARSLVQSIGAQFVLAKGGHFKGREAVDLLVDRQGRVRRYSAPRVPGIDPHGTGCTYSAAIAAALAQGNSVPRAVAMGKAFMNRALEQRLKIGGYVVLNQLPQKEKTE